MRPRSAALALATVLAVTSAPAVALAAPAPVAAQAPDTATMPRVRRGSTGDAVVTLQRLLTERGYRPGAADGRFGPRTLGAVLAFQRASGLVVDGIVGPRTWAALGKAGTTTTTPATTTGSAPSGTNGTPPMATWDALARCESGGRWDLNLGTGYYGGLQFLASSWRGAGGTGLPHEHPREEQIRRAVVLWERYGFKPWPACSRKLGLL